MENPILDAYVKQLLSRLHDEFTERQLPIKCHVLQAPIRDRFFVKLIGRGYPPPTNTFRWCTKNLRILPVSRFIANAAAADAGTDAVVALGIRRNESVQRDRSLSKTQGHWDVQREGNSEYKLFLPIINLGVAEVWDAIFMLDRPLSIDSLSLESLYKDASGECPVIKAPQSPPCASGRFGCWTCTVVRKDKSSIKLVEAGYTELAPFLDFRNWLVRIRNDPNRRWPERRNGGKGMGPFTIKARQEILSELRVVEMRSGIAQLPSVELSEIERLWSLDSDKEAQLLLP